MKYLVLIASAVLCITQAQAIEPTTARTTASNEVRAEYILCPDGTMINPGEKCPEGTVEVRTEVEIDGHVTVLKSSDNKDNDCDSSEDCDDQEARGGAQRTKGETTLGDVVVTKQLDKSSPKLAETVQNPDGEETEASATGYIKIDGIEGETTDASKKGKGKVEATWKVEEGTSIADEPNDEPDMKEIDKSTPKLAETVRRLDDDSDDDSIPTAEEEKQVDYILCPDGTMIRPGEKCPESAEKMDVDGHVTVLKTQEDQDCDDEDEDCDSPDRKLAAHELAHVVQQLSEDIVIEENAVVEVEEDNGEEVSVLTASETRALLGIFKTNLKVKIKLDEDGNVIKVKRPWYSIFAW